MDHTELQGRLAECEKVLIGLGEEWKLRSVSGDEQLRKRKKLLKNAYQSLYELVKDKDYFIITMATDAWIYQTPLGSEQERVRSTESDGTDFSCENIDPDLQARMDRIFPPEPVQQDSRCQRIVAPFGNETWRQCSLACTKDIWEPGEIPEDICPHCGAPLTGNTIEAQDYIEEGYLPQWKRYTQWLAGTWNRNTLILELGVGFNNPGVIRFPFEKTAYFNQKSFLYRVNQRFPQIIGELHGRAQGIGVDSAEWMATFLGASR